MKKLIILLLFPFALFGQDVNVNTSGAGDLNINVSGAGDLQLYRPVQFTFTADAGDMDFGGKLSTLTNTAVVINFGDGTSERVEGTDIQIDHTYSTAGDYIIWIDNAINLTKLDFGYYGNHNTTQYHLSGDIVVVQNLTNLIDFRINNTSVSGDIVAVQNLTNLIYLYIYNTLVSGDIVAVQNLTNLIILYSYNTSVSGDIVAVQNLTNLINLYIYNTSVSGDIVAVQNLTNLINLYVNYTSVSDYTSTTLNFTVVNINIQLDNLTGLDATEISNLLIDLDAISTAWTTPQIDFTGCGEAYADLSGAGQTAYDSLVVKGWTIGGL